MTLLAHSACVYNVRVCVCVHYSVFVCLCQLCLDVQLVGHERNKVCGSKLIGKRRNGTLLRVLLREARVFLQDIHESLRVYIYVWGVVYGHLFLLALHCEQSHNVKLVVDGIPCDYRPIVLYTSGSVT